MFAVVQTRILRQRSLNPPRPALVSASSSKSTATDIAGVDAGPAHPTLLQALASQSPDLSPTNPTKVDIAVNVSLLSGEVLTLEVPASATVSSIKALLFDRLGHDPKTQQLLFGASQLPDAEGAMLETLGVCHGSTLTLVISGEPLGQSSFQEAHGERVALDREGSPVEVLSDIELQSWQAAWHADEVGQTGYPLWSGGEAIELCSEDDPWGNVRQVDFYWTTRADGCRYEYWSTAPGDNEYGVLLRVDAASFTVIGSGSDEGVELFEDMKEEILQNDVVVQLLDEDWPLSRRRVQQDDWRRRHRLPH